MGWRVGICSAKQNAPHRLMRGVFNSSLTMSYFHTGTRTIIGAEAFHCPVRDGKEWDHLAMVIRLNRLLLCTGVCRTANSQSRLPELMQAGIRYLIARRGSVKNDTTVNDHISRSGFNRCYFRGNDQSFIQVKVIGSSLTGN